MKLVLMLLGAALALSIASPLDHDKPPLYLPPTPEPAPFGEPTWTEIIHPFGSDNCLAYETDGRSVQNLRRVDCSLIDLLKRSKS